MKLSFENQGTNTYLVCALASGETLFVPGTEFEPAAAAHLAGMLAGVWHALPRRKLRIVRRYLAARASGA